MSIKHKASFTVYSAWNYQREIDDLNKQSEQGWQLTKGGCFHSKFIYNPDIRYCYQIDFRKVDDLGRYIETFREQDWEYINSTFNGWHFFRKIYDPNLPETAYEIFTDRQSLEEMNRRWAKIALILSILIGAIGAIDIVRWITRPQLPVLLQTVVLLFSAFMLLRGVLIMWNSNASRNRRGDSALLKAFLFVLIIGSASGIVLAEQRPHISSRYRAAWQGELVSCRLLDFAINYPDQYYLDLKLEAERECTVELVDDTGKVIFTETGTHAERKNMPLLLNKGSYTAILKYDSDYNVEMDIN